MLTRMKHTAVIDTSVFVSALMKADTAPRQVLGLCLQKAVLPLMGNALLAEYEAVLSREWLFDRSPLPQTEREDLLDAYLSVCRWVPISYLWRPNLRDEADNHLIDLAVAGNAEWIITGNTADLGSGELIFPSLRIVTPTQFIAERN